jgi:glycosyltransferase involved in cell wall biosynthesis
MPKLQILILIQHYLPGTRAGGPVRTTSNLIEWLGDKYDFFILTSDRDLHQAEPYPDVKYGQWQNCGKAQVRYLAPQEQSLKKLKSIINGIEFDFVYLDGIFPTLVIKYLVLQKLRWIPQKPVLQIPRGQLKGSALERKWLKKRLFLLFAKWLRLYQDAYWHASNETEHAEIISEFGKTTPVFVIPNMPIPLTTIPSFQSLPKEQGALRLVFMSRLVAIKNLDMAIQLLARVRGNIQFDIYGSIEDAQYWQQCQNSIQALSHSVRVSYCGTVEFKDVLSTLVNYHALILPTQGENFGQVILEALCAGRPVLISDQTPWNNITENEAGWALPLQQPEAFIVTLQKLVDMAQDEFNRIAQNAANYGKNYIQQSSRVEAMQRMFELVVERQ